MPRLFIGLELPANIVQELIMMRENIQGARWQSAAQLHLTLFFVGRVDNPTQAAITQALGQVHKSPLNVQLQPPECPGDPDHPRHLWLPAEPVTSLSDLHKVIAEQLAALGLTSESRRFIPHVTLARFSRQAGSARAFLATHAQRSLPAFTATRFALFKSTPTPTGSRYDVVERFALAE